MRMMILTLFALLMLGLLAPLLYVMGGWLAPASAYVGMVSLYIQNGGMLAALTLLTCIGFGLGSAWLIGHFHFKGCHIMRAALVLPMAVPAYVNAVIYGQLLEAAGPVQSALRAYFELHVGEYYFPSIRSLWGAALMLGLGYYPYMYLLVRVQYEHTVSTHLEAARQLGASGMQQCIRIALPLIRPALVASGALVMMETFADYGVVSLYGIPSFTTGIYNSWFAFDDLPGAMRLSSWLLMFAMLLLGVEHYSRRHLRHDAQLHHAPPAKARLTGWRGSLALLACMIPVTLGFIVPLGWLLYHSIHYPQYWLDAATWQAFTNALLVGCLTAGCVVALTLLVLYCTRLLRPVWGLRLLAQLAAGAYAVPGTVIAVGLMSLFILADHWLMDQHITHSFVLSGSIAAIIYACSVRFYAVGLHSMQPAFHSLPPHLDDSAFSLGATRWRLFARVHIPLLRPAMGTAALLVFIDTIKELPATLMVRPYNFSTLAVRTYELASDDLLFSASATALLMIILSVIPLLVLQRTKERYKPGINGVGSAALD